jgi:hypothetical protein
VTQWKNIYCTVEDWWLNGRTVGDRWHSDRTFTVGDWWHSGRTFTVGDWWLSGRTFTVGDWW